MHFVGLYRIFILQCTAQENKEAGRLSISTLHNDPRGSYTILPRGRNKFLHLQSFTHNPFHFLISGIGDLPKRVYKLPLQQTQLSCAIDRHRVEG